MKKASRLLSGLPLALVMIMCGATAVSARELTVATWGGTFTQKQRSAIIDPFSKKYGIPVLDAVYTGGLGKMRSMAEANNIVWDVVQVEAPEAMNGCAEGLFETLDRARLEHADEYSKAMIHKCAIGAVGYSFVIGYNTKLTGEQPKTWADFWNLKKYPGKRGLRRSPQIALEAALIADGVPFGQIYEVLSTPAGVDRAFAKLDQIKPKIVWWEAGAQPAEWLSSGNVAMSLSYVGRLVEARAQNAPVRFGWDDAIYAADYWVILKGTPNLDEAYKFVNYATTAPAQAAFSKIQPVAPVNMKAAALLPPDRIAVMPVGDHLKHQLYLGDAFWVDHLEALTERFNAWLAK